MRVALINKVFSDSAGGAESYALRLAKELRRRGVEIERVGMKGDAEAVEGAGWHEVNAPARPAARRVTGFDRAATEIVRGLGRVDVRHALTQMRECDTYFLGGGVYRQWLAYRYPARAMRWMRLVTHAVDRAHLRIEDAVLGEGDALIVANSRLAESHVHRWYPAAAARTRVVYHGVDHARFRRDEAARRLVREELGIGEEERVLIFAAHNWRRKGLGAALEAMAMARGRGADWKLIVAGRGKPARWARTIARLGLADAVRFVGARAEIEAYYAGSDVFVLPTLYDPFAVAALEAMAAGLPVITTAANGVAEVIEEGRSGYVTGEKPGAAEVASALVKLADERHRRACGEMAMKRAAEFTWERHVDELLRVFEESMERRGIGVKRGG